MKILVICQHYFPEPFRITDICEQLVKRGHEVSVVTAVPNYPMGKIYPGYEKNLRCDETVNGVMVHRCNIYPRKPGAVNRLINYYSYPFKSVKYINTLDSSFDLVFINQLSPVMMAKAGLKYAKKHNKKSILYCLDLWPASLHVGGINGGIIYKWFYEVSKRIYKSANTILVASKSFSKYFETQFNIKNTLYLPQYGEDTFTPDECQKTQDEYIDLMFAGNIGKAQSLHTIINAAHLLKDIDNLRWHIVGDGTELTSLKNLAKKLNAPVIFHGRKPIDEMPKYYSMADAMIVSMKKDPVISCTLPGKVQSYMAAGKPIIASIDGETARVINEANCGLVAPAQDAKLLARCVRNLVNDKSLLETYAKNSLDYYRSNFSKENVISNLEKFFTEQHNSQVPSKG